MTFIASVRRLGLALAATLILTAPATAQTARAYDGDWEGVLAVTEENATRAGLAGRFSKIIGDACRHAGEQISCCRADHHQIRFAAKADMPHLAFVAQIPQGGVNRAF